ncbi:spermidine synthase [Phycicoccus badiiscoriae]|uniref:Spermidine synthase n=1 Tax=Pedococcus badiiscoriae TaxID=642776 RepID=A0A852WEB3_9MICO|nr:fused MFS/spermidine synthase [Pedococcus badiiscoriae]NYG07070.1 spermidine synthase [Pedococcus badiiscoriae]
MQEFRFEVDDHGGSTVLVDGYPQSYVSLTDPELLVFGYMQHLAAVADSLPAGPLAVTHVGGAAMTLPRYVQHTRPGSPQIVLEPDAALTEAVRHELPLPRGHRIRVRPQRGREGVAALKDSSAGAVVVDAFADSQVPADLTSAEWFADVARVLLPGGVLVMNTADEPDHRHVARVHAGLARHLPHTAAIAEVDIWKRRRFGNLVLVGSSQPLPLDAVVRSVAKGAFPSTVREGAELTRALGSGRPFTDADAVPSPPPPTPPDVWRIR